MFVERTWREMWGRWFTGELRRDGIDVKLVRVAASRSCSASASPRSRRRRPAVAVTILGANLPQRSEPRGHRPRRRASRSREIVSVTAEDIAIDGGCRRGRAGPGPRDVSVAGAVKPAAVTVYDQIDGIKVLPHAGMARVGGAVFPKQLQQFEAVAFHNGPDGKPDTKDDLHARHGRRRVEARGIHGDVRRRRPRSSSARSIRHGPLHAERRRPQSRSAAASATTSATSGSSRELAPNAALGTTKPMRARAHLLVTVPVYMRVVHMPEAARSK